MNTGIFGRCENGFANSPIHNLIKTKYTDEVPEEWSPEELAVKFFDKCVEKESGLVVMPGTPISDISDKDMPSPRGSGGEDNDVIYSDDDDGQSSREKFRMKVALQASVGKLGINRP